MALRSRSIDPTLVAAAALLVSAGCDPSWGIERWAVGSNALSEQCVDRAVRGVVGITVTRQHQEHEIRGRGCEASRDAGQISRISFECPAQLSGSIALERLASDAVAIRINVGRMGERADAAEIAAARRVIAGASRSIARNCGPLPALESIDETNYGGIPDSSR